MDGLAACERTRVLRTAVLNYTSCCIIAVTCYIRLGELRRFKVVLSTTTVSRDTRKHAVTTQMRAASINSGIFLELLSQITYL